MIGDSIYFDIEEALNIGMNAILFDYENKYNKGVYQKNINYEELKNIL